VGMERLIEQELARSFPSPAAHATTRGRRRMRRRQRQQQQRSQEQGLAGGSESSSPLGLVGEVEGWSAEEEAERAGDDEAFDEEEEEELELSDVLADAILKRPEQVIGRRRAALPQREREDGGAGDEADLRFPSIADWGGAAQWARAAA